MIVVEELVEVVLTKTNNFFQKYRVVLISSISILVIRQEAYFSKANGSGTPAPFRRGFHQNVQWDISVIMGTLIFRYCSRSHCLKKLFIL